MLRALLAEDRILSRFINRGNGYARGIIPNSIFKNEEIFTGRNIIQRAQTQTIKKTRKIRLLLSIFKI